MSFSQDVMKIIMYLHTCATHISLIHTGWCCKFYQNKFSRLGGIYVNCLDSFKFDVKWILFIRQEKTLMIPHKTVLNIPNFEQKRMSIIKLFQLSNLMHNQRKFRQTIRATPSNTCDRSAFRLVHQSLLEESYTCLPCYFLEVSLTEIA